MKTIVFTSSAAKQFDALPSPARSAIETALNRYAVEGRGDVKRLKGREGYRMRVGDYRVLFGEDMATILAVYIGRRQTTTYSLTSPMAQTITTPNGEELVVLSRAEYDRLVSLAGEAEEDAADIQAYDEAIAEGGGANVLPAEISASLLRGVSLVAAIRKWRGIKQTDLAERAGLSQGYLSDLESGRRKGSPETLIAIAEALEVPQNWLI